MLDTLLMSPKRNQCYRIIWVLIIGIASAGPADGRPDGIENFKITTNVSAGNSANSMSYEFGYSYENDYGNDQTYTGFNSTESTTSSTLTKDVKAKAQVPIGPLPLDESIGIVEEYEFSTVLTVIIGTMCLFIAAVAVGLCYTKPPSRSEIRSSTDRALSRGISLQDGTVHENEQLLDDDVFVISPVQSQTKANTMKNV